MKFTCNHCGKSFEIKHFPESVKFCIYCGKPLSDDPQQTPDK